VFARISVSVHATNEKEIVVKQYAVHKEKIRPFAVCRLKIKKLFYNYNFTLNYIRKTYET